MLPLISRLSRRSPAPAPARAAAQEDPAVYPAALALARELFHAVEQFIISTPDFDARRFLQRMRGTAAGLTPAADIPTLCLYREWCRGALQAFGALQRRYVGEREDEMWRLIETYARASAVGLSQHTAFAREAQASHGRLREMASLSDVRTARLRLEEELQKVQQLAHRQAREDRERLAALNREVAQLEKALKAIRGQADYDALTGIYHRAALAERLKALLAERKPCSLAILDLDNFKTVNDTLGHLVGDRMLSTVAQQLQRIARSSDLVARWGGDEYCFVAPGFTAEHLTQRLSGVVARRHITLETEERACSALLSLSVGIASSRDGDTPETLFDRADQAMSCVKRAGGGGIRVAAPPR